jgi:hypothetical protein
MVLLINVFDFHWSLAIWNNSTTSHTVTPTLEMYIRTPLARGFCISRTTSVARWNITRWVHRELYVSEGRRSTRNDEIRRWLYIHGF